MVVQWSPETIAQIKAKAMSGKYQVRSMGSTRKLPHFDDLVILPAQTSRPPIDNYREPCNTKTTIGGRFSERMLELDYPIMLGAMSFGALNKRTKVALAKGCSEMGISSNTGEGGLLPSERKHSKKLVVQYASGRFGVSAKYLRAADAVEIKIGQGAKPGMGGHLMGEKVTKDVSKVRGIPEGTDALSPARHMDIVGPEDLALKIQQLREITEWKTPIIVKFSPGRVADDVKIAAKAGADAIAIDGMQAGTGAAPNVGIENAGIPTIAALVSARKALEDVRLKDDVALIISGGIRNGADIAKAMALGADAVQISTAAMIAIGCTMCKQCHKGMCPVGITSVEGQGGVLADDASQKFVNYLKAITMELRMMTQLTGLTDVHNLDVDDLRSLNYTTSLITGVDMLGL